jgi:hypothetical protein
MAVRLGRVDTLYYLLDTHDDLCQDALICSEYCLLCPHSPEFSCRHANTVEFAGVRCSLAAAASAGGHIEMIQHQELYGITRDHIGWQDEVRLYHRHGDFLPCQPFSLGFAA